MNAVFFGIVAVAFASAIALGTPGEVGKAALDSAKASVELASSLGSTGSSTAPKERRESKSPARKGSAGGRRTKA